jgi:hypothetical protein
MSLDSFAPRIAIDFSGMPSQKSGTSSAQSQFRWGKEKPRLGINIVEFFLPQHSKTYRQGGSFWECQPGMH